MLFSYLALIFCRTLSWKARHFLRSSVQFFPDPWLSNILRIGTQFKPRTDRFVYPYFLFTEKQLSQFLSASTFPIWHFKVLFLFSEAMKTPPTPFIFREVNLERCEFSHIHLALGLYDLINELTKNVSSSRIWQQYSGWMEAAMDKQSESYGRVISRPKRLKDGS